MKHQAPSENSCPSTPQNCYEFLSIKDFRFMYNKIISSCKKYHQWEAKNWFLERLIQEKIIPSYFKIKNKNHDTSSEAAILASLEWMKSTLNDNRITEKTLLQELTDHYNSLIVLTPDHLKEELKSKVQQRGIGFIKHFKDQKLERLNKFLNPSPPKENNKNQQKNNKNKKN